jgi:hypothetical protein
MIISLFSFYYECILALVDSWWKVSDITIPDKFRDINICSDNELDQIVSNNLSFSIMSGE